MVTMEPNSLKYDMVRGAICGVIHRLIYTYTLSYSVMHRTFL